MKKYGLRALAGGLALLLAAGLGAPVTAKAQDDLFILAPGNGLKILEITQDMVDDDGEIVISGGEYDRIVISKEVDAKDIYFDQVVVKEMVVESGGKSNIQLWEMDAEKLTVKEPELEKLTVQDLRSLLEDPETQQMAMNLYLNSQAKDSKSLNTTPSIVTMGEAKIEEVVARANVDLDLATGEVGEVVLEASDKIERAKVTLKNYKGDVAYKGSDSFNAMTLKSVASEIGNLSVEESTAANYLNVISKDSSAEKVEVSGNAKVSLNVTMGTLDITEAASAAAVTVAGDVKELNVNADGAKVEVAPIGNVAVAKVAADNVSVSGSGVLSEAKITGTGAYVSTPGTEVEGNNNYVGKSNSTEVTFTDIDLTAGEGATVTKNADGSSTISFDGQYKNASFAVPKSIDKTRIIAVRVEVTTSQQFGLTLTASKGNNIAAYPGYGISKLTEASYYYGVPASSVISSITFQSLSPTQADLKVKAVTFVLKEEAAGEEVELWTSWTEDFNDDTLLEGVPTDSGGALNWGAYERDADGYGKYTCTAGWQGMCVVLDNLDSDKAADFTVSMKVKKVDGTDTMLKFVDIAGGTYRTFTSSAATNLVISEDEWVTFDSSAITVEAGEGFKVNICPKGGGSSDTMTFLVDEVTVTRVFKEPTTGGDTVDLAGATKCTTDAYQVHHFTNYNLVEYAGQEINFSVDMVRVGGDGSAAIVAQDSAYSAMYVDAAIGEAWETFTYTITVPENYADKESAYLGFRWKSGPVDNYADYTFYFKNFTFNGTKADGGSEGGSEEAGKTYTFNELTQWYADSTGIDVCEVNAAGALSVTYSEQYKAVQYGMPTDIDTTKYTQMVFNIESPNGQVTFKCWQKGEEPDDTWNSKIVSYNNTAATATDVVVDISSATAAIEKVDIQSASADGLPYTVIINSITFK